MSRLRKSRLPGLVFVAFMFAGMGIGYLTGHTNAGMFIGMGVGFAAMAVLYISNRENREA